MTPQRSKPRRTPLAEWTGAANWLVLAAWSLFTGLTVWTKPIGDYLVESDFYGGFGVGARGLLEGHFDAARYGAVGPLYEMLVALLGLVGLDLYRAALVVSWTAGLVALWALVWAVRHTLGGTAALLALLVAATNPTLYRFATSATSDALFLAGVAGTLALAVAGRSTSAGLAAAAATLTRSPGLLLFGALGIATLLPAGWRPWRERAWQQGGLAIATGLVVVAGWFGLIALAGSTPQPALLHKVAYEVFAREAGVSWDEYEESMAAESVTPATLLQRDPGRVLRHTLGNLGTHATAEARENFGWALAALALLGLLLSPATRRLGVVWCFAGLFFLAHAAVSYAARDSLPLLWCAAVAAAGVAAAGNGGRWRVAWLRRWFAPLLAVAVLAVVAIGLARTERAARRLERQWPVQVLEVTRFLPRPEGGVRRLVLAHEPHGPWYAAGEWVVLGPTQSLGELVGRVRATGATHLFFSWPEARARRAIAFLLLPDFAPPGLRPLRVSRDGLAVLYEVGDSLGLGLPDWNPTQLRWRNAEAEWTMEQENLEALRLAASGRHRAGDLKRAEFLYREIVVRDPADLQSFIDLGKVLILEGRADAALRLYEAVLARGVETPDLWRGIAESAARVGQRERAIEALERYLAERKDPGAAAVLQQLRSGAAP